MRPPSSPVPLPPPSPSPSPPTPSHHPHSCKPHFHPRTSFSQRSFLPAPVPCHPIPSPISPLTTPQSLLIASPPFPLPPTNSSHTPSPLYPPSHPLPNLPPHHPPIPTHPIPNLPAPPLPLVFFFYFGSLRCAVPIHFKDSIENSRNPEGVLTSMSCCTLDSYQSIYHQCSSLVSCMHGLDFFFFFQNTSCAYRLLPYPTIHFRQTFFSPNVESLSLCVCIFPTLVVLNFSNLNEFEFEKSATFSGARDDGEGIERTK